GTLGAWVTGWLEVNFHFVARWAVFCGATLSGSALAIDFVLVRIRRSSWRSIRFVMAGALQACRWLNNQFNRPKPAVTRIHNPATFDMEICGVPLPTDNGPANPLGIKRKDIPIRHHALAAAAELQAPVVVGEETPMKTPVPIVRPEAESEDARFADYVLPPLALLEEAQPFPYEEHDGKLRQRAA